MTARLHRAAVTIGLALAAVAAVWWLGSTRLILDRGADTARCAADALHALLLVRGMMLALLGPRTAALFGWRQGFTTGVALVAPSWPVVLLAWSASTIPLSMVLIAETLLLAATFLLPLIGIAVARLLDRPKLAVLSGTTMGVGVAAALWASQASWAKVLS